MSDLHDLLERSAARPTTALDLGTVVRRSRRRRTRRVATRVAVAVVVVGALVGVVGRAGTNETAVVAGVPDPTPIGRWRQGAPVPFEVFGELAPLSGGRILLASGTPDRPGAIYDPSADSWTLLPPAPLPNNPPPDGLLFLRLAVAEDRLAVATNDIDGGVHAAVYDAAMDEWIAAPPIEGMRGGANAVGWTGTTLVLVRAYPGPSEVEVGTGFQDWSVDEPITLRWDVGDAAWSYGEPAPLPDLCCAGIAADATRIAFWGGTTEDVWSDVSTGDDPSLKLDTGAVYDIATDSWSPIDVGPLPPGRDPAVAWYRGQLVVASPMLRYDPEAVTSVAAVYDPDRATWAPLPTAPGPGVGIAPTEYVMNAPRGVPISPSPLSHNRERSPTFYLDDLTTWVESPYRRLVPWGDTVIAVNDPLIENPVDEPFAAVVRIDNRWVPVTEAPFASRRGPELLAHDDQLYVVGGRTLNAQLGGPDSDSEVWILDLSPDAAPALFNVWMHPNASDAELQAVSDVLDANRGVTAYNYVGQEEIYEQMPLLFPEEPELLEAITADDLPTRFAVTPAGRPDSTLQDRLRTLPGVVTVVEAHDISPLRTLIE